MIGSRLARDFLERGRADGCAVIDMHGHGGEFAGGYLPSASLERTLRTMDRSGVRAMACAHHVAMMYDLELGNRLMQSAIDAHPGRLFGYWVVNPNHPAQMERDLRAFERTRGFLGFKLWADYHLAPITSPRYAPALRYADEAGLLQLVHTWAGSRFDGPELLGEIAARYPRAAFLMGHSGQGDFETAASIARDLPNVYLDLASVPNPHDFSLMPAGMVTPGAAPTSSPQVGGIVEHLVEVAGSRKVVFGSDLPWYSVDYHLGAVLFARIDEDAKHDILHRNAERLMGANLPSSEGDGAAGPA